MASENLKLLRAVAIALGDLNDRLMFVGGSVVELYAQRGVADEVRVTEDVDAVVQVTTLDQFYQFEAELIKRGFAHDMRPQAPICRWRYGELTLDVMPSLQSILGFSNRWYESGFALRAEVDLDDEQRISVLPVAYFLATKLEAVLGRGGSDLRMSQDFEDIVYLMDSCENLEEEIQLTNPDVREFINQAITELSRRPSFGEAIACALPVNAGERLRIVQEKIRRLTNVK